MKELTTEMTQLTADLAIHQKLADEPNDVGGLTAQEMERKFDEAGLVIRDYLNHTHLPEVKEALEDTLKQAEEYADKKVVEIGAGDMAMTIYDTLGRRQDVYGYARDVAKETLGDAEKFGYVCVASSSSQQFKKGTTVVTLGDRVDMRGIWDEEKKGFVMPAGAKAFAATGFVRWARESFVDCRVKLVVNQETVSKAEGPSVSNGTYYEEGVMLACPVKEGDLVQLELEVASNGSESGAVNLKFLRAEILL